MFLYKIDRCNIINPHHIETITLKQNWLNGSEKIIGIVTLPGCHFNYSFSNLDLARQWYDSVPRLTEKPFVGSEASTIDLNNHDPAKIREQHAQTHFEIFAHGSFLLVHKNHFVAIQDNVLILYWNQRLVCRPETLHPLNENSWFTKMKDIEDEKQ